MTIKEIRNKHNLTQQAMSNMLGIPFRTIQNWEGGINEPADYLVRLIEFYLNNNKGETKMLTIKTYNSNCTITDGETRSIDYRYDGDTLRCYSKDFFDTYEEAVEDWECDMWNTIRDAFPSATDEDIEDAVSTIGLHVKPRIDLYF